MRFDASGVRTLGELAVTRASGSVTNLALVSTESSAIPVEHMDFDGDCLLEFKRGGGFAIRGYPTPEGRSSIRAIARAGDAHLKTRSPEIDFDLTSGATLSADVHVLEVAPNGLRLSLSHGELQGVLDRGTLATGTQGSMIEAVTIKKGARIRAEIPSLTMATDELSTIKPKAELDFTANLQLEGEIENRFERIKPIDFQEQRFEVESAEINGRFRLALGLRMHNSDFAANSRSRLDGRLGATVRSRVDVPAALERFRQRAAQEPPASGE
jgi:hypothetical protein